MTTSGRPAAPRQTAAAQQQRAEPSSPRDARTHCQLTGPHGAMLNGELIQITRVVFETDMSVPEPIDDEAP